MPAITMLLVMRRVPNRPLTYLGMADAAALVAHLGIAEADVVGYSMGGGLAIQLDVRHPQLVRALLLISARTAATGGSPSGWR